MRRANLLFSDYFFYQITCIEVQVKALRNSNVHVNNLLFKSLMPATEESWDTQRKY